MDFFPISWDRDVSPNYYLHFGYYGFTGTPGVATDGSYHTIPGYYGSVAAMTSEISADISAELAKAVRLNIQANRSGSITVDGTVENVSAATLSSLTVRAYAVEIITNNHAINTVIGDFNTHSIGSLGAGAVEPFSLTVSAASNLTVVIAVYDSSHNLIDCIKL